MSREAVNSQPAPSVSRTGSYTQTRSRSPTGSIRTILSMESHSSLNSATSSGTGSRSTIYVPPIGDVPDMDDRFGSEVGRSVSGSSRSSRYQSFSSDSERRRTLLSSYHDRTVDDTVISGQDYLYPGDPRVISGGTRRRLSGRLRRSGSMTDLGDDFASNRTSSEYGTPQSGDEDDSRFFSAGESNGRSSFYSSSSFTRATGTGTGVTPSDTLTTTRMTGFTTSDTQIVPSTLSYRGTESASLLGDSHSSGSGSYTYNSSYGSSPYTNSDTLTVPSRSSLSRAGGVRRRTRTHSGSSSGSGYQPSGSEESAERERRTELSYSNGSYTPSGSYTTLSGSYTSGGSYTVSGTGTSETGKLLICKFDHIFNEQLCRVRCVYGFRPVGYDA